MIVLYYICMFRTKLQHSECIKCPIGRTADLIGDSSVLIIIRDVAKKSRRFSVFHESLPGVSTRTLTLKLKMLETEGILSKKKFAEYPPRVEYALTKKGKGLLGIVKAMEKFGKQYL